MKQQMLLTLPEKPPLSQSLKNKSPFEIIRTIVGKPENVTQFEIDPKLSQFSNVDSLSIAADQLKRLDENSFALLTRLSRSINDLNKKNTLEELRKYSDTLSEIPAEQVPKKLVDASLNDAESNQYRLNEFLSNFKWQNSTYMKGRPLKELCDRFGQEITQIDERYRDFAAKFSECGSRLLQIKRRKEGNLLVRNLDDLTEKMSPVQNLGNLRALGAVRDPIYYVDTPNFQSVIVVVRNGNLESIKKKYCQDNFENTVVPETLQVLQSDNDCTAFLLVILKEMKSNFVGAARELEWFVRDFEYNKRFSEKNQEESINAAKQFIDSFVSYGDFLANCFSNIAHLWVHVRVLRTYVESLLCFGIDERFHGFLVAANQKNMKAIVNKLNKEYGTAGIGDDIDFEGEECELYSVVGYIFNLQGLLTEK